MRRNVMLSILSLAVAGLFAVESQPLEATGSSWLATRLWLSSVTPQRIQSATLIKALLNPPRIEQNGSPTPGGPTVTTDKGDYHPGETVIVTGSGWQPGAQISLTFHETLDPPIHADETLFTIADDSGNIDTSRPNTPGDDFVLEDHDVGVGFILTAQGLTANGTNGTAQTTFTDSAAANIDQCRNGSASSPNNCVSGLGGNAGWVNGNAGGSNSHYIEGYSIPYRAVLTGLDDSDIPANMPVTINLGFDVKNSGKHAIDFLTHYQRLEPHLGFFHSAETVTPLSGVSGVSATVSTSAIPPPTTSPQPLTRFNSLPAGERLMTLFGGNITSVAYVTEGSLADANSEAIISVTFVPDSATAVLAWGGHIAMCEDWGQAANGECNSAAGINGSSYHMRLLSWVCDDGASETKCDKALGGLGNQDRSLSTDAVFPTGKIVIRKFIVDGTEGEGNFSFTGLGGFSLSSGGTFGPVTVLANAGTGGNTSLVYQVTEQGPPDGYDFDHLVCDDGDSDDSSGQTATIKVSANETVTCDFYNTRERGFLRLRKVFDAKTSGFTGTFALVYNCGLGDVTVDLAASASQTAGPFAIGTQCSVSEPTLPTAPTGWTFGTPVVDLQFVTISKGDEASAVVLTVTNSITRDQGFLKLSKVFDPLTSGFSGTFAVVYNCGGGDQTVQLAAGGSQTVGPFDAGTSCTVSEPTLPTAPTGWTFGTASVSGSPAAIVKGNEAAAVVVTVTNTISRDQGYLKLSKIFDPLTSGFSGTFAVVYNCGGGDQTVQLAAGGSQTVGPFNTGTSCTVSEPTLPTAPTGWTFGTPSVSGSPATIVKGDQAAAVLVTVTNSISRDMGTIVIVKNAQPRQGTFAFATTGEGYPAFQLTGATAGNGNIKSTQLPTGNYTATESTQLGWILTGIGGGDAVNPNDVNNTRFFCTLTTSGSGTSVGTGDLLTQKVEIALGKNDTITCVFENTSQGVTRTQGFWATHSPLANIAWFGGTFGAHTFPGVADRFLCPLLPTREINTLGKLMGGFWSDISRATTNSRRSSLDQARMQLLQQLLAAELNASAFGSGNAASIAAWEAAYCGSNEQAIKNAQSQAAAFNSAGDSGTFTPGTSADSKNARAIANQVFWDTLP